MPFDLCLNVPDTLRAAPNAAAFAAACNALHAQFQAWEDNADDESGEPLWTNELKALKKAARLASSPDGERMLPALQDKLANDWDMELYVPVAHYEAQPGVPAAKVDVWLSVAQSLLYTNAYQDLKGLKVVTQCVRAAIALWPTRKDLQAALDAAERMEVEVQLCDDDEQVGEDMARDTRDLVEAAFLAAAYDGVPVEPVRRAFEAAGLATR